MKVQNLTGITVTNLETIFEQMDLDFEWFMDVYDGVGIYELTIGSCGELDGIEKNDEYFTIEELKEVDNDYDETYYNVSIVNGLLEVTYSEENGSLFVNVI